MGARDQPGWFDIDDRLKDLSPKGRRWSRSSLDGYIRTGELLLEKRICGVDCERLRLSLKHAGHSLSDDRTEFLVAALPVALRWMRL